MTPPPVVTGLSPNEGPPGTRIKIRGEHFGTKPTDLIGLTICDIDCLLSAEWKSQNKIIAISGLIKGKGEVIVTTRNGGRGTCNVSFNGKPLSTIGPMKESAVWIEEAPLFSWGRHSLSPSSYQQEDPLGLSVEENEKKFPEEDLSTFFPSKSGDIASNNFSPGWFLLENHQATSFNDLQAGLLHLRRKVEGQKEGQLSFLKANIGSVLDQVDTLVNLKDKYEKDLPKFGLEPTHKLEKAIKESEREARKLFDDVLARKDRAEKTRNALNVLARFRFLFCLPCVIDRNIKKGEYDIVINDYMRVKNLFNKTDVPIFKTALSEVEKRIEDLQKKLHNDLRTMPITVDQQKRLIRYLVNLESPYDPAWDAIKSRSDFINKKIKLIYSFHKSLDKGENNKQKSTPSSKYSKYNVLQPPDLNIIPVSISFTDEICLNISETFPDLWKIGQAYFTGELQVKIEAGRQVEFKHMVMTIIESFCKSVRAALIPNTLIKNDRTSYGTWTTPENDEVAPYLPEVLRSVRSTYATLIKLDLPSEALDIVSTLLLDLRIHCMSILFKQTSEQIKQLSENWKIDFSGKYSGITELPINFFQLIQDVIQIVKESVLSSEQREESLLDNPIAQKELDKQLEIALTTYHNVLNNISSNEDVDNDNSVSQPSISTPNSYKIHESTPKNNVPSWEHRLLITLSNCMYSKNTILDNIADKFKESGFNVPHTPLKNARSKLEMLQNSILDKYLEQKSDPLVGTIENSMYLGRFDWDTKITPTDIRPYAKECIINLIYVHAEVNSISPMLLENVLPQVVETIAEELYRLMSCVQKFSRPGAQQARTDIVALQEFFQAFSTPKARGYFQEALDIIPKLESAELTVIEDILKQCRARMKIQIACLRYHPNGPVQN